MLKFYVGSSSRDIRLTSQILYVLDNNSSSGIVVAIAVTLSVLVSLVLIVYLISRTNFFMQKLDGGAGKFKVMIEDVDEVSESSNNSNGSE